VAIVKFDVRFGRMFRVDRTDSGSGQFVSESVDITDSFEAVFDLENVEVGWLRLGPDRAPDTKLVARGEGRPEQPSEKHKYGFRVVVKLSRECSGNNEPVRELLGSARDLWFGMDRLLRDYNAEKDKHPGLLPLVALKGPWSGLPKTGSKRVGPPGQKQPESRRMKEKHVPNFRIVGWVPRGDFNLATQLARD